MAKFSAPKSPARSVLAISEFLGCDFTNSPANVDENKSPNCVNMIRDVPGKVRKCMGYQTVKQYDGVINGYHFIHGQTEGIYHVGTKLYKGDTEIYSGMNDARSRSWQFDNKLYIVDGLALLVYDGGAVVPVSQKAKIPTVTISKDPYGGGSSYEPLNLLQAGFTELFLGTDSATEYQLSFGGLDETLVEVAVLSTDGEWVSKTETNDFTVDRENGIVTFLSAPGKSPVTGEDNVKITAYRTVDGYADRIHKCTIGTLYGVNGALDRLFLSGNPDFVNYDWYSEQYDPTYFPDTAYSVIGTSRSAIVGYSIINNYLATHKDEMETDRSIIMRAGEMVDSEPTFRIVNTLQGPGSIAPGSFAYLINEPLFLTRSGIYAVTSQDITGEKYSQNRSFYLNGKLLKENGLEKAFACVYNDMYWLCVNGVVYILDGIQPLPTDEQMPYATRQYVGFYRTNIPATCMWKQENELYFGTADGKVCKFYTDVESLQSYQDDGVAITSTWETPDLDGRLFYKNKSFRHIAVRLQSAIATSIKIYAQKKGLWSLLKHDKNTARYFTFADIDFSKFTFSCDSTQKIINSKIRIKKVDKARFRFENDALNEPFGIYDMAFEFVENGNYKG